jgi:indolepyruvate ferredoxin oxidoreductase beta subunit
MSIMSEAGASGAAKPGVTNVVIAGLGGQGILTASGILARVAFEAGLDVKKSEIHGMSQRGGSVSSDVRFGERVWSPMVPQGEADFLVALDATQVEPNRACLRPGGTLLTPDWIDEAALGNRRGLNVAMLGALSRLLDLPVEGWEKSIRAGLAPKLHESSLKAFALGRESAAARRATTR